MTLEQFQLEVYDRREVMLSLGALVPASMIHPFDTI
jgi:hypothetical protein